MNEWRIGEKKILSGVLRPGKEGMTGSQQVRSEKVEGGRRDRKGGQEKRVGGKKNNEEQRCRG